MDYNIISADGHVDLHWLPPNLFKENCAHRFRELMPYVRHDGQWVDDQGGDYGVAQGTGATKGAGASRLPPLGPREQTSPARRWWLAASLRRRTRGRATHATL